MKERSCDRLEARKEIGPMMLARLRPKPSFWALPPQRAWVVNGRARNTHQRSRGFKHFTIFHGVRASGACCS